MANILVIDDDTSLLQMMSIMLKRAGHTTVLANDGKQGISVARDQHPDMVIVDVMMPDVSGYDVCSTLRKDPSTANIPLLMLTALSQPEHRGRAEDSGADGFVTKPVTRDDLVKHVDELLKTGPRNFPEFTDTKMPPVQEAAAQPAAPPPPPPPGFGQADAAPAMPAVPQGFTPAPSPVQRPPTGPLGALPVVVVMGLGSGAGATTIAVNLSLALMQYGRTCLVDLSNRVGQVAVQLRIAPRGTWQNLAGFSAGTDKRMIAHALTMDHPSGVAVIAAPSNPVQERLNSATLHYVFSALAEGFSRIIVDLPMELDATSIATLNEADHICLILGNDPSDLMAVPNMLHTLEAMRLPGQIHISLNHTRPHGISYESAMQTVNSPLAVDIPYEPLQIDALSSGAPLLMSQPGSLFARTVLHLARLL